MAEYVKKEEVIKLIREDKVEITPNLLTIAMIAAPNGYSVEDCYKAINDTCNRHIKEIRNLPAADVRPVVRCRDCEHKGWVQEPEHGKSVDYCRLLERCVDKQFFCAAGERKTNCGADMGGET